MQKFLSIPVTGQQSQLISLNDVKIIEVGDSGGPSSNPTTHVTLYYSLGKKVTITHGAVASGSEEWRDFVQSKMISALQQMWHNASLVLEASELPTAVSDIEIA